MCVWVVLRRVCVGGVKTCVCVCVCVWGTDSPRLKSSKIGTLPIFSRPPEQGNGLPAKKRP